VTARPTDAADPDLREGWRAAIPDWRTSVSQGNERGIRHRLPVVDP